jgi:hypothetical protein
MIGKEVIATEQNASPVINVLKGSERVRDYGVFRKKSSQTIE